MTDIADDTIYAGGDLSWDKLIFSTDHGASWQSEAVQTDTVYQPAVLLGIIHPKGYNVLGSFYLGPDGSNAMIAQRTLRSNSVESYERIIYGTRLYPNPATDRLTLQSNDPDRDLELVDMLGRAAIGGHIGKDGSCTLGIAALPAGVYSVVLNHDGAHIRVGKVAVLSH